MKKSSTDYTKGETGNVKIIKGFPPPSELVAREDNIKVILGYFLRSSLDFFKREAKE